uniref:Uncharacterized protein n=1 Tax=Romanomermis culicivorax TaxID=13658 RepID=A0A915K2D5_ROMCU
MEKYDCKVECFDPQFSDLDAELACFTTKTKNFSLYIIDFKFKVQCDVIERVEMTSSTTTNDDVVNLHQSTWNILHRLDEILKLIADNYLIKFLKSLQKEEALINLYYDLINRLNCIISQGLTAVICCLLHEVYNGSATTNSTLQKWKIC